MAWPKAEENIDTIDISVYQNLSYNTSSPTAGRIDFKVLAEENPNLRVVFCRAAGAWSGVDPDFQYNYERAGENGFDPAVYLNNNPSKTTDQLMVWWKLALKGINPKLIRLDCETSAGQTPRKITAEVKANLRALKAEWPNAEVYGVYSAQWWWAPNIIHGWEVDLDLWVAHWPHIVYIGDGDYRVAQTFEEIRSYLPISNNFTPYIPTGFVLAQADVWQFSASGIITGIYDYQRRKPYTDLNLMLKTAHARIFSNGGTTPTPTPPTEPVKVLIQTKAGEAVVRWEEV